MLRKRSPWARHRGVWGRDSIAPLIRNINNKWRWAINLTSMERSQGIHWKWGWVSARYDLAALHKKLISRPSQEANLVTLSENIRHHNFVARYTIIISCILNFRKRTVQHLRVFGLSKWMFIYDLISILTHWFSKFRSNRVVFTDTIFLQSFVFSYKRPIILSE